MIGQLNVESQTKRCNLQLHPSDRNLWIIIFSLAFNVPVCIQCKNSCTQKFRAQCQESIMAYVIGNILATEKLFKG